MREGKIQVVRHEGEPFFRSDGVLLDLLEAYDFWYADIAVIRNGKEIDKGQVYEVGTHAPIPMFMNFENLLREYHSKCMYCPFLLPEYFQEGDELYFAMDKKYCPAHLEVDFRKAYVSHQVSEKLKTLLEQTCAIKDNAEFDLEWKKYEKRFDEEVIAFVCPPLVIFRRKS